MVASVNDYQKEKQFRDLNAKKEDVEITVVRAVRETQAVIGRETVNDRQTGTGSGPGR